MCQKYYGLEFVSLFYFNLLSPISPQIYPKFPVTVWNPYVQKVYSAVGPLMSSDTQYGRDHRNLTRLMF